MDFPLRIYFGDQPVLLHAVLEVLAFFIGFRYFLFLRRKQTDIIIDGNRVWIIIGAVFGSLIGSRLLGAFEHPDKFFSSDNMLLYAYSAKTVVGGFLGGLAGVELIKKRIGENKASGDLFVFPIILALCIGRAGCFSMGVYEETYGISTSLPTGMNLGDNIPRHPVALYEIVFLIGLWMVLKSISRNRGLANGALFKLFMIAYLAFRLLLELIKPHTDIFFGLSTIQLACIGGLLYYAPYITRPKKLLAAYA